MKHIFNTSLAAGLVVVLSSCATRDTFAVWWRPAYYYTAPSAFANSGWPRLVPSGATTYTIYEPQVDSWDGHQLMARSAVGVQSAGQPQPTYGVVAIQAITLVDKTKRTVSLENIQIIGGDFPSARQEFRTILSHCARPFRSNLRGFRWTAWKPASPSHSNSSRVPPTPQQRSAENHLLHQARYPGLY